MMSAAHPVRKLLEQTAPALTTVHVRYHGVFAYIDGQLPEGVTLPLCRLRYGGSATRRQPSKKPSTAPVPPPQRLHRLDTPRRTNDEDH